jgi:ribosomal protein S24E
MSPARGYRKGTRQLTLVMVTRAQMYKVKDANTVFLYGFRTQFGGGKSSGFGLVYDSVNDAKRFEPKYRLIRVRPPSL